MRTDPHKKILDFNLTQRRYIAINQHPQNRRFSFVRNILIWRIFDVAAQMTITTRTSDSTKDRRNGSIERRALIGFLVVVAGLFAVVAQAYAQISVSEYKLKSAYIYSFGNYTTWPLTKTANRPDIIIGVCGTTPIFDPLSQVAAKRKIKGRQIQLTLPQTRQERAACDILFVAKSVPIEEQQKIIRELAGQPVLVAGEVPNFIANGGMVEFRLQETTVKFDINVEATKKANLVLNAKLLRLASKPPLVEVSGQTIP